MECSRDVYREIYFSRTLSPTEKLSFLDTQPEEWNALAIFIEKFFFNFFKKNLLLIPFSLLILLNIIKNDF